jgi:excinuclease ABC subunit A
MASDLKKEVLEVTFHNKSIHDVLTMTIDAVAFLETNKQTKNNSKN